MVDFAPDSNLPNMPGDLPEETAMRFFLRYRWKGYRRACPRCDSRKVAAIRRNRLRCLNCRYEFGDFTGTYLGLLNIDFKKWHALIRMFELEVSARQATKELGMSYPTVLKAFHIIRMAIAAQSGDFQLENGQLTKETSSAGGPDEENGDRALCEPPVFGFRERGGKVRVEALPEVGQDVLKCLKLRKIRRSSIAFTNKFQGYDRLIFYANGQLKTSPSQPPMQWVASNGQEGFWSYAKHKLVRFHGVSSQKFPLYLKELEFRYNQRHKENSFAILADYLTKPVALVSLTILVNYLLRSVANLL